MGRLFDFNGPLSRKYRIGLRYWLVLFNAGYCVYFHACVDGNNSGQMGSGTAFIGPLSSYSGAVHDFAALYGLSFGIDSDFSILFILYSFSVAFYMPTLALSNSVAYNALTQAGLDTVKDFPPIRVFGTIGFICSMWLVDLMGFQANQNQFVVSGILGVILFYTRLHYLLVR